MRDASLASYTSNNSRDRNPFATPTLNATNLPALPEPIAQPTSRSLPQVVQGDSYKLPRSCNQQHHEQEAYPHKSASISSTGTTSTMTPISSIDLEKSRHSQPEPVERKHHSTGADRQSRERNVTDPEKATHNQARISPNRHSPQDVERVPYFEDEEVDENRQLQEKQAVKILLHLAGPCVVLSFLNAIWMLISLMITAMAQPVRLCARRPTFGQQLGGLLGPALNLQLKCIYTYLPPHADEDTSYRPGTLLVTQALSPFLSLGLMIAAWVVAVFWVSSAVVGDPAGTNDKRDDGRETALALRDWWERWLTRSIGDE